MRLNGRLPKETYIGVKGDSEEESLEVCATMFSRLVLLTYRLGVLSSPRAASMVVDMNSSGIYSTGRKVFEAGCTDAPVMGSFKHYYL